MAMAELSAMIKSSYTTADGTVPIVDKNGVDLRKRSRHSMQSCARVKTFLLQRTYKHQQICLDLTFRPLSKGIKVKTSDPNKCAGTVILEILVR